METNFTSQKRSCNEHFLSDYDGSHPPGPVLDGAEAAAKHQDAKSPSWPAASILKSGRVVETENRAVTEPLSPNLSKILQRERAPVPEGPNESSLARSAWKQEKSGPVPEGRLICSLFFFPGTSCQATLFLIPPG